VYLGAMQPRPSHSPSVRATVALGLALTASACGQPKDYETTVEISRKTAVERDEKGVAHAVDLELSFVECPGSQIEVLRADEKFATCIAGVKKGDRASVTVRHRRRDDGRWEAVIVKVSGCDRVAEANDPTSFTLARECTDIRINGVVVGFECNYQPENALVARCPWFKR
jgi:hypothetical protein